MAYGFLDVQFSHFRAANWRGANTPSVYHMPLRGPQFPKRALSDPASTFLHPLSLVVAFSCLGAFENGVSCGSFTFLY